MGAGPTGCQQPKERPKTMHVEARNSEGGHPRPGAMHGATTSCSEASAIGDRESACCERWAGSAREHVLCSEPRTWLPAVGAVVGPCAGRGVPQVRFCLFLVFSLVFGTVLCPDPLSCISNHAPNLNQCPTHADPSRLGIPSARRPGDSAEAAGDWWRLVVGGPPLDGRFCSFQLLQNTTAHAPTTPVLSCCLRVLLLAAPCLHARAVN